MAEIVPFHHGQGLTPVRASEFGSWPAGVALQIHAMDTDPFFIDDGDIDAARALVAEAEGAELFLYPGDQHLFTDNSLAAFDENASVLVCSGCLSFSTGSRRTRAWMTPAAPNL